MNLTLISSQPWIIHRWIILTPSSQLTMRSEEGVNIIISNDPLERFSWTILLNDSLVTPSGVDGLWDDFSNIIVVSSRKEVLLCLDLFFCQNSVIVTEKSMTAWEQSFTKTISNYFCVISPYEFRICWKSCWKVDKFFTIEQERRSTDAWIFFNFFQPNTNDNSPSLRNCWVFFYLLFFVSLFLLHQSLTDLFL